ncbi:MAG: hypothetical protein ACKOEC_15670, partial [Acidimicrobiia bacterium]
GDGIELACIKFPCEPGIWLTFKVARSDFQPMTRALILGYEVGASWRDRRIFNSQHGHGPAAGSSRRRSTLIQLAMKASF